MPNPFSGDGDWYKGNLHTHTTLSDGELSPQETIKIYAEGGYDFLALTDHRVVCSYEGLDSHGMTLITGCEVDGGCGELGQALHVVALGLDEAPSVPESADFAQFVATTADHCQVCWLGHPFWSLLEAGELLEVRGYVGLEVYNTICQNECGRGGSEFAWDVLLAHGRRVWGFAVDDAHHREDYAQAWVWARCKENSPEALLSALARGNFYASTGPEIYDVTVEDGSVTVSCSPSRAVTVIGAISKVGYGTHRLAADPPFEQVRLHRPADGLPFRIEVVDDQGRKAWTNPIFSDELDS